MCELFAMNASRPSGVGTYLSRLMPRGGRIGPHADGWGVAYYEGRAARIFKDPTPAADSHHLALLAEQGFTSTAVIAHIRKANPSVFGRATANTHPFEREWNGRSWVFAHNGKLPGLQRDCLDAGSRFQPLGDTDSELAFCCILDAIDRRIGWAGELLPERLLAAIRPMVDELAAYGEFNFILSDGEHLYVHAHTHLHSLCRTGSVAGERHRMTLLATAPLTAEPWQRLLPGSLHVYRHGEERMTAARLTPAPCWSAPGARLAQAA